MPIYLYPVSSAAADNLIQPTGQEPEKPPPESPPKKKMIIITTPAKVYRKNQVSLFRDPDLGEDMIDR